MPWFYARAGSTDRLGPVSSEQMRGLLTDGQVGATDLVWREGMVEWMAVERVPKLATLLPRAQPVPRVAPVAAIPFEDAGTHEPSAAAAAYSPQPASFANHVSVAAPDSLAYYAPRADMPYRAQQNLAKYAAATGPTGEWPLNDEHIAQFAYAVKLRKRINGAFSAARLFFALSALGAVVMLLIGLFAVAGTRGNAAAGGIAMLFGFLFYAGLAALYFFAGQAIRYCRVWGSLTLAILHSLWLLLTLLVIVFGVISSSSGSGRSDDVVAVVIGCGVGLLIGGAICYVFWRGFAATKPYLSTPLWCQEAIAVSETSK